MKYQNSLRDRKSMIQPQKLWILVSEKSPNKSHIDVKRRIPLTCNSSLSCLANTRFLSTRTQRKNSKTDTHPMTNCSWLHDRPRRATSKPWCSRPAKHCTRSIAWMLFLKTPTPTVNAAAACYREVPLTITISYYCNILQDTTSTGSNASTAVSTDYPDDSSSILLPYRTTHQLYNRAR